ncbi:UDP-N-acetylmuramoyl-L-alanyl-D-glutamate--2,6-diaminopimelate ligase [Calidifontibacter sp. DB0510]|uniref:UDP-N-acetylmuramyl-tripeptide synthetase n=1 Tax=Metallococcus carri TaxID=1656884 RepID=A0A967B395_9MICO|nr:UDP-N-acetylmuramoyl-L-alanyl-D-glutamate--2,6-diaminopimelate ligase [Metallococcus carri]NHN57217.1 UDP-N-acetylmuramoyl-L-alanyl-D-glutamate--2,6-diaminopimelate ligase [Metallococcus carri]NOP37980.1 UDP-N-acetylmuramoyl-L-alanyl-D-glutamate--2,6-diaminopimelate ligase [Calidifontibacter sp. DB2511S]
MKLQTTDLARILGVDVPPVEGPLVAVTNASQDVVPGGVFVAVKGFTSDGAKYAPAAIEAGAQLIVAEEPVGDLPTAVVPNARIALAQLAVAFAGDPSRDLTVYGVTGTNGKTTSSYVLHAILATAYGAEHTGLLTTAEIVVGTQREPAIRTTGEAPTVQGNLARMRDAGVTHVVLETSSHGLHLHRVLGTHYAAALFTNLTRDHLDLHGSMEDYYLAKRTLFERTTGPKLANGDDEWGRRLADEIDGTLTFGAREGSAYRIEHVRREGTGTVFDLTRPTGETLTLRMPLLGDYNVHNVAGAAAITLEMGMPPATLIDAVAEMPQVPGRFERIPAAVDRGFEVVVDYAHTDIGLRAVLEVAREVVTDGGRLICVYGAAGARDAAKRPLMGRVASELADVNIITTDDAYHEDPAAIADEVMAGADPADTTIVLDRRDAIATALGLARPGDVVVVAGKGHERVQHLPTGDVDFHDATVVTELLTG